MAKTYKKSASSYICWFPSIKNQEVIWVNSKLEMEYCYLLEYDRSVIVYKPQPFRIGNTAFNNKYCETIPDFLVKTKQGSYIVEVKYFDMLEHTHTKKQVAVASQFAEEQGIQFMLITDDFIHKGKKLANIKLFWRYARLGIPHNLISKTIDYFSEKPQGVSLNEIVQYLAGNIVTMNYLPVVLNFLFHGFLRVDVTQKLGSESSIWLNPSVMK